VLDVGRVELGDLHDAVATTESYRGVLDPGTRLGAHFVTAASLPAEQQVTDVADLFGRLVQDCDAYQLVPLLVPQPDTSVATLGDAFGHPPAGRRRDEHLGYLRVLATDLDAADDAAFRQRRGWFAGHRARARADRGGIGCSIGYCIEAAAGNQFRRPPGACPRLVPHHRHHAGAPACAGRTGGSAGTPGSTRPAAGDRWFGAELSGECCPACSSAAGDRVPVDRHAARRGEDCDHPGDLVPATLRIDPIVEPLLRAASPLTPMPMLPPVTSARRPADWRSISRG
jgi:hypothetical protein